MATLEQVRKTVKSLKALWRAGRRSRKRLRQRGSAYRYGAKQGILVEEAQREGLNPDTMKKAWHGCDSRGTRLAQDYEKPEIEELYHLIEQHQAPFRATHMVRLLSLERGPRDDLAVAAIQKGWTVSELRAAILQARDRRPSLGRHPYVPEDLAGRLVVLEGLCLRWARWCSSGAPELPDELQELVQKATRAVERVRAAASAELKKPRSPRRARKRSGRSHS